MNEEEVQEVEVLEEAQQDNGTLLTSLGKLLNPTITVKHTVDTKAVINVVLWIFLLGLGVKLITMTYGAIIGKGRKTS